MPEVANAVMQRTTCHEADEMQMRTRRQTMPIYGGKTKTKTGQELKNVRIEWTH